MARASTSTIPAATALPIFRFGASSLPDDEAFEAWRQIMARMFGIDRTRATNVLPRGGA